MPTGTITRSCPGSSCLPKHNPSQPLALTIALAKTLNDAKLYWSSPDAGIRTFNGSYQNNGYTLTTNQVGTPVG